LITRARPARRRAAWLGSAALLLAACSAGSGGIATPEPTLAPAASVAVVPTTLATLESSPSLAPSPTAGPTPVPTKVPGAGKIVMAAYGFAITLPEGWRQIPLDGSSTGEIEALLPAGSQIAAAFETELATAVAAGMAFMAIDLRSATLAAGNISTVNVNVQAPSNLPLTLMESLVTGLLDSAPGVTNVAAKLVTLPAGQAIRVTYTLTITPSVGQSVKLAATQFVLLSTKHTYTISFACQYAAASSCRSQADAMMKTFDIL
jgi:hypothetical protein